MATYSKVILSNSTNGQPILVTTTSGSLTSIHTTLGGTTSLDEIYLYASNSSTGSCLLSILWGGTVQPNNLIQTTIYPQTGRVMIADGMLLQNGLSINAYAQTGSIIIVDGFVNRIQ